MARAKKMARMGRKRATGSSEPERSRSKRRRKREEPARENEAASSAAEKANGEDQQEEPKEEVGTGGTASGDAARQNWEPTQGEGGTPEKVKKEKK